MRLGGKSTGNPNTCGRTLKVSISSAAGVRRISTLNPLWASRIRLAPTEGTSIASYSPFEKTTAGRPW